MLYESEERSKEMGKREEEAEVKKGEEGVES